MFLTWLDKGSSTQDYAGGECGQCRALKHGAKVSLRWGCGGKAKQLGISRGGKRSMGSLSGWGRPLVAGPSGLVSALGLPWSSPLLKYPMHS